MSASERRAILLSDDLIFTSRIVGTARALGLLVQPARNVEGLLRLAQPPAPTCAIVDLQHPGLDLPALIEQLGPMRIVAYGSHVDAATLHAARVAGCDPVLPRSRFVEELPTALSGWLGTEE